VAAQAHVHSNRVYTRRHTWLSTRCLQTPLEHSDSPAPAVAAAAAGMNAEERAGWIARLNVGDCVDFEHPDDDDDDEEEWCISQVRKGTD
jgi:hypothetical protein